MNTVRNKNILAGLCLAAAASLALPSVTAAQQDQTDQQQGQAVVRQRSGPSVDVQAGLSPRIIVLFPSSSGQVSSSMLDPQAQQRMGQGRVEVVAVQGPPTNAQQGQDQQQQRGSQPEQEIVFSKDQAQNGLVTYGGEQAGRGAARGGQASSLTFTAEVGGMPLKIEQQSGGGGRDSRVIVMTAKIDSQRLQQMMREQQDQQAQTAGGQGQGGQQEMTAEQRQQMQQQRQEQQQQRQQEMQKLQDQAHAVIFVYLDGEATEQQSQQ